MRIEVFEQSGRGLRSGFSLVEMLIVVVIIGLLAGIAAVHWKGRLEKAKIGTTRAQISSIKTAIKAFQLEIGRLPEDLDELVKEGDANWPGPFLEDEEVPKDAWNNSFRYDPKGKRIKVVSPGPDGVFDTDDDISK